MPKSGSRSTEHRMMIYNNTYCQVFTIREGKIRAVTEYMYTALVNEVFGV